MTPSKMRDLLRWSHIILGLVLLCYIYSPFGAYDGFRFFVKWIAVPATVVSGLWIWKFQQFNKFFKIGT